MIITGGKFKGRKILAPDEKITRPTLSKVREGVFNVLYSEIGNFDGKSFLDVFGGSGIIGLEALSRGFTEVLVFEKNLKAVQVIKKNYQTIGVELNLKIGDSLKQIEKLNKTFDVMYIDPPYYSGVYEEILNKIKSFAINSMIIVEHSENLNLNGFNLIKEKNYGGKRVSFLILE